MQKTPNLTILLPHKICYCLITYEAFSNPVLNPMHRDMLFSFLLHEICANSIYKSVNNLLLSMRNCAVPGETIELISSRIQNIKSIDDIFVLFNNNLKEIRSDTVKMPENRHLEQGGILDTFIRKCALEFNKMLFEELCQSFEMFKEFSNGKIEESHPSVKIIDEQIAYNSLFKGTKNNLTNNNLATKPANHFLNYIEHCSFHEPNEAIDSLHNYFHSFLMPANQKKSNEKPIIQPKMHYASLNLSSIHCRFGQLDEALLNIAETIKIAQSKNDREAIIYSTLWLSCILGEIGLVDLQKTLLQHMLMESHEQKLNYLFVLGAQNLASLEHTFRPYSNFESLSEKFTARLALAENAEPVWEKILSMATQKINTLKMEANLSIQKDINFMRPLCHLIKAFNYSTHGIDGLFSSVNKIQYGVYNANLMSNENLQNIGESQLYSYLFLSALQKSEESMKSAFELMHQLLKKQNGSKVLSDDWFSALLLLHKFELNRNNIGKCKKYENLLIEFAFNFKKSSHLAAAWESKNNRLLHENRIKEALVSIQKLIKFSAKHGLLQRTARDYLQIVQLYIVFFIGNYTIFLLEF